MNISKPDSLLSGELVSWIHSYRQGAIGNTYTLESHRRKGLAKAATLHLATQVDESWTLARPQTLPFLSSPSLNPSSAVFFSVTSFHLDRFLRPTSSHS